MTDKQPDGLTAGRVYNTILTLPPNQAEAVRALPFCEQLRIADLEGDARAAAIADLMKKKTPAAPAKKENA